MACHDESMIFHLCVPPYIGHFGPLPHTHLTLLLYQIEQGNRYRWPCSILGLLVCFFGTSFHLSSKLFSGLLVSLNCSFLVHYVSSVSLCITMVNQLALYKLFSLGSLCFCFDRFRLLCSPSFDCFLRLANGQTLNCYDHRLSTAFWLTIYRQSFTISVLNTQPHQEIPSQNGWNSPLAVDLVVWIRMADSVMICGRSTYRLERPKPRPPLPTLPKKKEKKKKKKKRKKELINDDSTSCTCVFGAQWW